jgi:DNA polymerase-1
MRLDELRQRLWAADVAVFDTETNTPFSADAPSWLRDDVVGVGFAWGPLLEQSVYVPATTPNIGEFVGDFIGPDGPKVVAAHNAKFDLHMVRKTFGARPGRRIHDTLVMAHLNNENLPKGLKQRSVKEFADPTLDAEERGLKTFIAKNKGTKRREGITTYGQIPIEVIDPYCRADCNLAWRLFQLFKPCLGQQDLWPLYEIELDLLLLLVKMEEAGVLVDHEFLVQQHNEMTTELEQIVDRVQKACGHEINIGSDDQLRELLYEELKLPVLKQTKGGVGSTDEETLGMLMKQPEYATHVPLLEDIALYGTVDKQLTSYIDSALEWSQWDGRVHADFFSCGARTGRFSCSKPNLQNITRPKEDDPTSLIARRAFICDPGVPMSLFDYDQIEMRGFAHYTRDPRLSKVFHDGLDVYSEIAAWCFGGSPADHPKGSESRRQAKTVGLAIIYGASGKRIGLYLGKNPTFGRGIVNKFFAASPRSRSLFQGVETRLAQRQYIFNEFGRRRRMTASEAYKGVNSLVQGWAADLIKDAMVRIDRWGLVKTDCSGGFRFQVHDEVRLDNLTTAQERHVEEAMTAYECTVPIGVSVKRSTTNWAEAA